QAEQPGVEAHVLLDGEVVPQAGALRHVADAELHRLGIARDVEAQHRRGPRRRRQDAAEHADRGRLPRAVGSEEAPDLARADVERDAVDGDERSEPPRQVADVHARRAVHAASLATNASSSEAGIRRSDAFGTFAAASRRVSSGIASAADPTSACRVSPKISTLRTAGSPRSARRASPRASHAISTTSPRTPSFSACGVATSRIRPPVMNPTRCARSASSMYGVLTKIVVP